MEKKRIIIHPGYNKTGSTSIQATLYSEVNREVFENNNIDFLATKEGYAIEYRSILREYDNAKYDEIKNEIIKKLNQNANDLIVSDEFLITLSQNELNVLKELFQENSKYELEFVVVILIRNPISYIDSAYQQSVKGGHKFDKQLDIAINYFVEHIYRKAIEDRFCVVFGRENTYVYSFEILIKTESGIVGGFLQAVGMDEIEIDKLTIIRTNDSLTQIGTEVVEELNKQFRDLTKKDIDFYKSPYIELLYALKGEKFKLEYDKMEEYLKNIDQDLEWLKNEYNIDYTNFRQELTQVGREKIHYLSDYELQSLLRVFNMSDALLKDCIFKVLENKYPTSVTEFKKYCKSERVINSNDIIYRLTDHPTVFSNDINNIENQLDTLIFSCKANDPYFIIPNFLNEKFKILSINIVLSVTVDTFIQIFYRNNNEGYSEENSNTKLVKSGFNIITLNLIHNKIINEIRIDLGISDAVFNISNLIIY